MSEHTHSHSNHSSHSSHSSSHHSSSHSSHSSSSHSSSHSSHSSSHRSSSSHNSSSSKRSKRKRSSDVKAYRKTRYFVAYLLFITLTVMSLGITAKAVPLNKNNVADVYVNYDYVSALYDDISTRAHELCKRNAVPVSAVDDVLTFEAVNDIDRAYILGTMSLDEQYSQTVYLDKIDDLSNKIAKSVNDTVKESGLKFATGQEKSADDFAKTITRYITGRITVSYLEKLQTIVNIGGTAATVATVISAVLTVALALAVITLGSEVYRNLRSICHAVSASALSCFIISGAYAYIKGTKSLYLFPTYLNDSIMRYLDSSANAVTITGTLLLVLSFVFMALVWKLKSDALDS